METMIIKDIQLPRGLKLNLPVSGIEGQPYYAIDTNELYMGLGESSPLVKVGEIENIVESRSLLPVEGKENKLYIVKNDETRNHARVIYMYDNGWQGIGNITVIEDAISSKTTVYSSDKINNLLNTKANLDHIHSAEFININPVNFTTNLDSNITDVQKLAEKIDKLTIGSSGGDITYSTSSPIPTSIGGITSGKTYTNATITQVLNDLLYPYMVPIDVLTSNISTGIYEYGTQINSITIINDIIKKSNNIIKVEYYKNNILLYTNNSPLALGGKDSYIDTNNINDTTNYYCKIYDTVGNITSNILNYTFVNPYYIGSNVNDTLTENDIKNLVKVVNKKSDMSYNFTLNNSRYVIAYPASYGNLSKILDNNSFNIISDFTLKTCNLNINSIDVLYNVYIFNNITTQFNFNIQFKY